MCVCEHQCLETKLKIWPWDARPRYCTATCCTPRAFLHHNKLWFINIMTSPEKNAVPDVHFPHRPRVADTSPLNITQRKLTMFETMNFWQRYCVMTGEREGERERVGKPGSLCWERSAPSLSRDTGAAFSYSLPGMRSHTAAFFSIIYLRRKPRSFSYDKRVIMPECVHPESRVRSESRTGADSRSLLATRGGLCFSPPWP